MLKKPITGRQSVKTPVKNGAKVTQQQLVVQLPAVTIKALKRAALERDSTVRAMLLEAVQKAGYPVPSGQAVDLRKA